MKIFLSWLKNASARMIESNGKPGLVFGKYLLLTNTVSSGALMFVGEMLAQKIERSRNKKGSEIQYDKEKLKQLTVVGISQGPLHHFTYLWMERLLPGNALKTVMKKILSDQTIVSPIFIAHFLYTSYFLEGKSISSTNDLMRSKFFTIYIADWAVWPVAQFLNFYFVPLQYRVLYINLITMFYNVFLCYVKNQH